MLWKSKQQIRRIRPNRNEYSHHRSYSPNLALSDFHIFGLLKDALQGRRFVVDDELKQGVREEFRRFSKEFHASGIKRLTERLNVCVDDEEDLVEK